MILNMVSNKNDLKNQIYFQDYLSSEHFIFSVLWLKYNYKPKYYNVFSDIIEIVILQGYIEHFKNGNPFFGKTKLLYLFLIASIYHLIGVYIYLYT